MKGRVVIRVSWVARATGLAVLLIIASATPALAECTIQAPRAGSDPAFGVAFVARVADVSTDVDAPEAGASAFTWHVALEVTSVEEGTVPATIEWNGWPDTCLNFNGKRLREGETIFVAAERMKRQDGGSSPFRGDVVVWLREQGGWRLHPRALVYARDRDYYASEMRSASTLSEIRAVVAGVDPPDTSAASTVSSPVTTLDSPLGALLTGLGVLVAVIGLRRRQGSPLRV
jgi:hypothetical protein